MDLINSEDEAKAAAAGFTLALTVVAFVWRFRHIFGWITRCEIDLKDVSNELVVSQSTNAELRRTISARDNHIGDLNRQLDEKGQLISETSQQRTLIEQELRDNQKSLIEAKEQLQGSQEMRHALTQNDDELWTYHKAERPHGIEDLANQKCKIFVVANNKGGVAKSTLSTCLAAYFSKVKNKKVLILDLDYQGSTSIIMTREAEMNWPGSGVLKEVLGTQPEYERCIAMSCDLNRIMPGSRLITSGYDLPRFEYRLMLQWLFGEQKDDIRFRLAKFLASPAVKDQFNVVIIDTGPRLTTCSIAAMAAAHYLIVPTLLDRLSVEATAHFLSYARNILRNAGLNPYIELLGVIKTMVTGIKSEEEALAYLQEEVNVWAPGAHIFENEMRRSAGFSNHAGTNNAYLRDSVARSFIDPIGKEINARISLLPQKHRVRG
ncbi:MAG: ParA family protein [Pseudomonadota bacterium]